MNDSCHRDRGAAVSRIALAGLLLLLAACSSPQMIKLESTPPGASVWTGAKMIGITPATVELEEAPASGKLDLLFRKDGFHQQARTHTLLGNPSHEHVKLSPLRTVVQISTIPKDCAVDVQAEGKRIIVQGTRSLYGADAGALSPDSPDLWGDKKRLVFQITITAPGYTTLVQDVPIERGTRHPLSYVLERANVQLEITSDPVGATVYDRRLGYLGTTPMTKPISREDLVRVADDPHHVDKGTRLHLTFSKPGYQNLEQSMALVLTDEVQTLFAQLVPE